MCQQTFAHSQASSVKAYVVLLMLLQGTAPSGSQQAVQVTSAAAWRLPPDMHAAVHAAQSRHQSDTAAQAEAVATASWHRHASMTRHALVHPAHSQGLRGSATVVTDPILEAAGSVTADDEIDRCECTWTPASHASCSHA